jgi:hypothetical protein
MTQKDYEYLFVAANLAHYHPTWGFTILVNRLKMFLGVTAFTHQQIAQQAHLKLLLKKLTLVRAFWGQLQSLG